MKIQILKLITKHVRGKPCTRSQVLVTHDRIIAFACLIGTIASLAAIAVLLVIITQLVFGCSITWER